MAADVAALIAAALLAFSSGASARADESLADALAGGKTSLDLRLRAEHVDNESATQTRDSTASTLRARLGYATGPWQGFEAALEYEGITAFDKQGYNDGTAASAQPLRPVIADPAGSELNQAWVRYAGIPATTVQVGRQRLLLDNQRFVGNVGWRQNEQTYDGAVLVNKGVPGTELTYAYLHNVNGIVFTNFPLRANLVNASYTPGSWLKAVLYGYWLDFEAPNAGSRQDSQTHGLRLTGASVLNEAVKLLYTVEYARQAEFEEASTAAQADYWLGEAGATLGGVTLKSGYEVLGSNGGLYAVQTPLATLHAHDGWADLFLTTPATGLRDAYASLAAKPGALALAATVHHFSADFGGADYGDELDASVGYAFGAQWSALLKVARYNAGAGPAFSFAGNVDTDKGWLQVEYRFRDALRSASAPRPAPWRSGTAPGLH